MPLIVQLFLYCNYVKNRSNRPSHHVGCSLVDWGCRHEHTTQETVASIKIARFIYNRVFKKKKKTYKHKLNTLKPILDQVHL